MSGASRYVRQHVGISPIDDLTGFGIKWSRLRSVCQRRTAARDVEPGTQIERDVFGLQDVTESSCSRLCLCDPFMHVLEVFAGWHEVRA